MKIKKITLGLCTALSLTAPLYADILVQANNGLNNEDLCNQVSGLWKGDATVSYGFSCNYKGTVDIKRTGSESLPMTVVLDRTKGTWPCPTHKELPLEGICENGTIKVNNSDAKLTGELKDGGHSVKVTGTIQYSVFPLNAVIDLKK